jgi:hypothetical protein
MNGDGRGAGGIRDSGKNEEPPWFFVSQSRDEN